MSSDIEQVSESMTDGTYASMTPSMAAAEIVRLESMMAARILELSEVNAKLTAVLS